MSERQIMIVGTGWYGSSDLADYYRSERGERDRAAAVVRRDGSVERTGAAEGERLTVAIENVGEVIESGGRWWPAKKNAAGAWEVASRELAIRAPYEYCSRSPYRGWMHYEYIGERQQRALRGVVREWMERYGIRYKYDNGIGGVCRRAVEGKSGVWLGSSVDGTRGDIHPQREIIEMIKAYAR